MEVKVKRQVYKKNEISYSSTLSRQVERSSKFATSLFKNIFQPLHKILENYENSK